MNMDGIMLSCHTFATLPASSGKGNSRSDYLTLEHSLDISTLAFPFLSCSIVVALADCARKYG